MAKDRNVKLMLLVDYVAANSHVGSATDAAGIFSDHMGLDCGPESIKLFEDIIAEAKTTLWNERVTGFYKIFRTAEAFCV